MKNRSFEGTEHFRLGKALFLEKEYNKSLEYFDKSIECGLEEGVYEFRGMSLQALEYDLDAIDDFDKAISQSPDDANLYFLRGLSRSAVGLIVESINDFTKAVELSKISNEVNRNYNFTIKEKGWQSLTDFYYSYLTSEKETLDMASKEQNMPEELKEKIWDKEYGALTYPHWKKNNKKRR